MGTASEGAEFWGHLILLVSRLQLAIHAIDGGLRRHQACTGANNDASDIYCIPALLHELRPALHIRPSTSTPTLPH